MTTKKMYYFHIGRGGRFNNANHKTLVEVGEFNESKIVSKLDLMLLERDSNGRFANVYLDNTGDEIITVRDLRDGLEKGRLLIEFDTIYDTDIFTTYENALDYERELIDNQL